MDNVTFITIDDVEHAIIEHADGSFTSMHKSTYDQLKTNEAKAE
jgi:translation elongation factor P/translation initiation factor 5A